MSKDNGTDNNREELIFGSISDQELDSLFGLFGDGAGTMPSADGKKTAESEDKKSADDVSGLFDLSLSKDGFSALGLSPAGNGARDSQTLAIDLSAFVEATRNEQADIDFEISLSDDADSPSESSSDASQEKTEEKQETPLLALDSLKAEAAKKPAESTTMPIDLSTFLSAAGAVDGRPFSLSTESNLKNTAPQSENVNAATDEKESEKSKNSTDSLVESIAQSLQEEIASSKVKTPETPSESKTLLFDICETNRLANEGKEDADAAHENTLVASDDSKLASKSDSAIDDDQAESATDKPESEKIIDDSKKTLESDAETDDAQDESSVDTEKSAEMPDDSEITSDSDHAADESPVEADEADERGEKNTIIVAGRGCHGIVLSERARRGSFSPENDVVTSEHAIPHDVLYDESLCEAQCGGSSCMKSVLFVAILLLTFAIVVGIGYMVLLPGQPQVNYAQKAVFAAEYTQFNTNMYATPSGAFYAFCSDERGIVTNGNGELKAEFWPGSGGCAGVRLSDDGSILWFVDRFDTLFEVRLTSDDGLRPRQLGVLRNRLGLNDDFEIIGNNVYWMGSDIDSGKPRLLLESPLDHMDSAAAVKERALPDDALMCTGMHDGKYAYVSGNAVHMVDISGKTLFSLSLEKDKFSCPAERAIRCSLGTDDAWAVLCSGVIYQGENQVMQPPVQYQNTGVRSGATPVSLLRHAQGSELVTPAEWVRLDKRGNSSVVKFEPTLGKNFGMMISHADDAEKMPLVGVVDGGLARISADGKVMTSLQSGDIHVGDAFLDNGSVAVALFNKSENTASGKRSRAVLWDLRTGNPLHTFEWDDPMESVNVSPQGDLGFIIAGSDAKKLHWVKWLSGKTLGSLALSSPVRDISWSDDQRYALLYFEDGKTQLFELSGQENADKKMVMKREYSPDVIVNFARQSLLWHVENHQVTLEQIETGARSVVHEKLSRVLAEADIRGVSQHPAREDVFFWGNSGIWRYLPQTQQINPVLDAAVTWVAPDRFGKWLASSAGLIEVSPLFVKPLPNVEISSPLQWVGLERYAVVSHASGELLWDVERDDDAYLPLKRHTPHEVRFIGQDARLHPSKSMYLDARGQLTLLTALGTTTDATLFNPIAAFGRTGDDSWCWRTANHAFQGKGGVCVAFGTEASKPSMMPTDKGVVSFMQTQLQSGTMPSKAFAPLVFRDRVKLSITTVPADASVIFVAGDGELPKPLVSDTGLMPAPFNAEIQRDDRSFGVAVTAPDYELRALSFVPNVANVTMRIPLLKTGAQDIRIEVFDISESTPEAVVVNEDTLIEMKSMLQNQREALNACLDTLKTKSFSMMIKDAALTAQPGECLTPIVQSLQDARQTGALPELSDSTFLRFDITLP